MDMALRAMCGRRAARVTPRSRQTATKTRRCRIVMSIPSLLPYITKLAWN